jgi:hypothetical protein
MFPGAELSTSKARFWLPPLAAYSAHCEAKQMPSHLHNTDSERQTPFAKARRVFELEPVER